MTDHVPTEGQPPVEIKQLLAEHQEALVLLLDPDPTVEGESTIACFMKLGDKSRLAAYLQNVLDQLLKTSRAKAGGDIQTQTPTCP